MKKDMYKQFVDFKTRHSLSNDVIAKMITEYANSELELARTYYSKKYNISVSTFYKSRDYAVIFCLVDNTTYKKLQTKSAINYSNNNKKNSSSGSIVHYKTILKKRQDFLNSFSNNEIKDIAIKYIEGVSVENIAIAYDTGPFAIKYLLKKGIVSLILDANIVDSIKVIVGKNLDGILKERERNKKILLCCLQKQIEFLESQINCYDLYFRNISDKPSLLSLQNELEKIIRFRKEVLLL